MKITEVYDKYQIPPHLQLHQLRVAGVAKLLAQNLDGKVEEDIVVRVGLLHDMGNIVKFRFNLPGQSYLPRGVEYWQQVQKEFKEKYGANEHQATLQIMRELGVSETVTNTVEQMEFDMLPEIAGGTDLYLKTCKYSDLRVGPTGVVSLETRISEGRIRYAGRERFTDEKFDRLSIYADRVEQQIFEHCSIKPEDITDESVDPLLEGLKDFEIVV